MKMTERSTVLDDNQLNLMLEAEDDRHNTSVDMLKDFKQMFETKKNSRKNDAYVTRSQLSQNSQLMMSQNNTDSQHVTRESNRLNQSNRNDLGPDYEKLNELFEEFKEQKFGIKPVQQVPQHYSQRVNDDKANKTKISIQEFMKLKQHQYGDKVQTTAKHIESQDEREKRLFQIMKKRRDVSCTIQ